MIYEYLYVYMLLHQMFAKQKMHFDKYYRCNTLLTWVSALSSRFLLFSGGVHQLLWNQLCI